MHMNKINARVTSLATIAVATAIVVAGCGGSAGSGSEPRDTTPVQRTATPTPRMSAPTAALNEPRSTPAPTQADLSPEKLDPTAVSDGSEPSSSSPFDFALVSAGGDTVSLASYRGEQTVILVFYKAVW